MKERYCKLMDRCVPGEELVRAAVKVRRPARRRLRLGAAAAALELKHMGVTLEEAVRLISRAWEEEN